MNAGSNYKLDRFYVALGVTYDGNGEVNYEEFEKYCAYFTQEKFLARGFSYIVNPEAGEIFALSLEERIRLMEIARAVMPSEIPVFGGVTGASLKEAVATAQAAKDIGLDGIFICPPLGSADITTSWDQEAYPEIWLDWVTGIDAAVNMPIILHPSTPANTKWGGGLSIPLLKQTIELCKNVVGWKAIAEAVYFPEYCKMLRDYEKDTGRHIGILAAGAFSFVDFAKMDCLDGCVSCYTNFCMEGLLPMLDACKAGNEEEAQRILDNGLKELFMYATNGDEGRMCLHTNFKVATWLRGLMEYPLCREPMRKPRKSEVLTLAKLLKQAGFEIISQEKIDTFVETLAR